MSTFSNSSTSQIKMLYEITSQPRKLMFDMLKNIWMQQGFLNCNYCSLAFHDAICMLSLLSSLRGFCISNVTISYQPLVVFTKKKKDENSCLLKNCSLSAYLHEVMDFNYVHYIAESIHLTHKNHWIQVFQSHPWTQVYKIQHVGTKSASPNTFLKERVTLCSSGCSTHLCNTSSCY